MTLLTSPVVYFTALCIITPFATLLFLMEDFSGGGKVVHRILVVVAVAVLIVFAGAGIFFMK